MESFHAYSRELLDKGRPSDITRAACELHCSKVPPTSRDLLTCWCHASETSQFDWKIDYHVWKPVR